jgi:hypothetical protein
MPLRGFAKSHARGQPGFQAVRPLIELGGLNEDENPQAVLPHQLRLANNCVRKGSMTGTRPGVEYGDEDYTVSLGATEEVQGIHEYARNYDASRDLIVVAEGKVYKDQAVAALDKATNSVVITAGQNNLWTFADFQDKMFAAGGAAGDSFWYWDGNLDTGTGELNLVGLGFDVQYVFSKWNMMFVGGIENSGTFAENPMVWRYCDYATDATVAANWKVSNVIPGQLLGENYGVGSYGNEFSTGIASHQNNNGDFLLLLTNKRIVSFVPNQNVTSNANAFRLFDTVGTGCVNQNAFVNLGIDVGDAVYLGPDGVHSLAQSQEFGSTVTEYLSWPIRKTWDTVVRNRLKYASGTYWPTEGLVIFCLSTQSSAVNDTVLCLDIKNSGRLTPESVRWYKWKLNGIVPNIIRPVRGADGKPYPYVGGNAGEVVRFDRGYYSDLSTNTIDVEFRTRDEDFGLASREKTVGDAFISIQGVGDFAVRHTFVLDDGTIQGQSSFIEVPSAESLWGAAVWDEAIWGGSDVTVRHRIAGIGSSPTISHMFSHSGAQEPFWIGLLNQEIMISGPTDDATNESVG